MSDEAKRPRFFVPDLLEGGEAAGGAQPGGMPSEPFAAHAFRRATGPRNSGAPPAPPSTAAYVAAVAPGKPPAPAGGTVGREILLPPTEAHHAAHVLRLKAGDAVELFDGRGGAALGRIVRIKKGEVAAAIEGIRPAAARPEPLIHLGFAVPKGDRLDWLLEKASEMGAASLGPVLFERSVAGGTALSPAQRQRWLARCIAAAKQSGLDFLPQIEDPRPLAEFLSAASGSVGLCGDLAPGAAPLAEALRRRPGQPITILVGPEGGLTDVERQLVRAAGFALVRLGRTTLRTETAALALLAGTVAIVG